MKQIAEDKKTQASALGQKVEEIRQTTNDFVESDYKVIEGTSYEITNDDNQKTLYFTSATTITITLSSRVTSRVEVLLIQDGAGDLAFVTSGSTSIKGALSGFDNQNQGVTLTRRYDGDWNLLGNAT